MDDSDTYFGPMDVQNSIPILIPRHIGPDIRLSESGKKIGVIGLKCLG